MLLESSIKICQIQCGHLLEDGTGDIKLFRLVMETKKVVNLFFFSLVTARISLKLILLIGEALANSLHFVVVFLFLFSGSPEAHVCHER